MAAFAAADFTLVAPRNTKLKKCAGLHRQHWGMISFARLKTQVRPAHARRRQWLSCISSPMRTPSFPSEYRAAGAASGDPSPAPRRAASSSPRRPRRSGLATLTAGRSSISAGDLIVSLHDIWGTRWLADRLITLVRGCENDWAEFKATLCPPSEHMERYGIDRGNGAKHVKGDYYLNVVKTIVSFMNSHGGVVLLGIAQERGAVPVPADSERLCESLEYAPLPLDDAQSAWDTDKWLLYVRNVLKGNEWTDRYGTTWNCSEVLDDPYVRLFNGVFHGRPVIVIAVLPVTRPAELRRCVSVGRRRCNARSSPDGQNCHWPHGAPEEIRPSVVPFRIAGDTASVVMKWSFAEVATQWRYRKRRQERFARLAIEELEAARTLPYGLLVAIDSMLGRTYRRAAQLTFPEDPRLGLHSCRLREENGQIHPLEVLQRRHSPRQIACLTIEAGHVSSAAARVCVSGLQRHVFGSVVPILISLEQDLNRDTMRLFIDEPERLTIPMLLDRFGGSTCGRKHWEYVAHRGGLHVLLNGIHDLPEMLQLRLLQSAMRFQEAFEDCAVTIVGLPESDLEAVSLVRYQFVSGS
jgi:hypothetical protein